MAGSTSGGISDLAFVMNMRIDESSVSDSMRTLGDMKSKMSTTTFSAIDSGGSTSSQDIADTKFAEAQQYVAQLDAAYEASEQQRLAAIQAQEDANEAAFAAMVQHVAQLDAAQEASEQQRRASEQANADAAEASFASAQQHVAQLDAAQEAAEQQRLAAEQAQADAAEAAFAAAQQQVAQLDAAYEASEQQRLAAEQALADAAETEFAAMLQHVAQLDAAEEAAEQQRLNAVNAEIDAIEGDMTRALRRTLNIEDQINFDYQRRLEAIDAIQGATAQQTAELRLQAAAVRDAATQTAINAGQIGGIGGAGLTGNRIQEFGRGFEDFTVGFSMAKTNIEGVAMGLRGSANNAAQLAASFNPMVGATVAIGASLATVIVPMVARWLYDTKAIEEAQEKANEKAEEWLTLREESNRQDLKRVNRGGGAEFMAARDKNAVALKKQLEWELGELAKYEAERDKMKRRRLSIGLRNKTKEELAAEAGIADITPWIEDSREKIKRNNEISRETSDAMEEKEQKRRDEDFDQKMKFFRKLEEAEAKAEGSVAEMKLKHKREAEEFEKESMGRSEVDRARGRELMASRQQDELDKPFNDEIKRQEEQLDRLEKAEEKGRGIKERHAQEWADTMIKMEGASDEQRLRARLIMEKRHAREVASERLDAELQANADQQDALQERMQNAGNAAGPSAAMVSGTQAAESAINRALSGGQSVEGTMKAQLKELEKVNKNLEKQKRNIVASIT